jgi:hypothetical protein
MSYILTKGVIAANSVAKAHYEETTRKRVAANAVAANPVDAELWAAIDTQTAEIIRPIEGEAIYSALFPLAKTVALEDITMLWRVAGGEFEATSSIDGQHEKPLQKSGSEWDGTIIPLHTASFSESFRTRGRDRYQFIDDQAAATRGVRKRIIDDLLNGTPNASFKNQKSLGIRANPNVQTYDLQSVDLTSSAVTWAQARGVVVGILQALTGSANGAVGAVDIFISSAAYFNLLNTGSTNVNERSFLDMLQMMPGVKSIQMDNALTAKEIVAFIARQEYIAPLVGAAVSTYAQVRAGELDNYNYTTWAATGLQIKADAAGGSGVLYASGE